MQVFIDTNIWLGCFNPDSDLEALRKLKSLIKEDKIVLLLPEQVEDEYLRNIGKIRERIIGKNPSASNISINPTIIKPKDKEKDIKDFEKKVIDEIERVRKEIKDVEEKFNKRKIKLNKHLDNVEALIKEIFFLPKTKRILISSEIIEKAKIRHLRGNPPKKEKENSNEPITISPSSSYGDAINWESLLGLDDENLTIISRDADYAESNQQKSVLNRFLVHEWEKKNKGKILFSNYLGEFLNKTEPEKPIKAEAIKKEKEDTHFLASTNWTVGTPFTIGNLNTGTAIVWAQENPTVVGMGNTVRLWDERHENYIFGKIRCPKCGSSVVETLSINPGIYVNNLNVKNYTCTNITCRTSFTLSSDSFL